MVLLARPVNLVFGYLGFFFFYFAQLHNFHRKAGMCLHSAGVSNLVVSMSTTSLKELKKRLVIYIHCFISLTSHWFELEKYCTKELTSHYKIYNTGWRNVQGSYCTCFPLEWNLVLGCKCECLMDRAPSHLDLYSCHKTKMYINTNINHSIIIQNLLYDVSCWHLFANSLDQMNL